MPNGNRFLSYSDIGTMAAAVACASYETLASAIAQRQQAWAVLSGGSTPAHYLPLLARQPLDWSALHFVLADERLVPQDSPDANAKMLRAIFFGLPGPNGSTFHPLTQSEKPTTTDLDRIRTLLPRKPARYDLVLLGMGEDGHIASLFPNAPQLAALLNPTNGERIALVPPPTTAMPAVARATLTLAELSNARRIILVIQGESKRIRLMEATDPMRTPVAALQHIDVFWCP
jgi:6-phosphogluconolactonase